VDGCLTTIAHGYENINMVWKIMKKNYPNHLHLILGLTFLTMIITMVRVQS